MTDSIGITLVLIPSGTFRMGSAEREGEADEHPPHEVRISRPFYLGIHEVTQGQYRAVMGNNPSWFSVETESKDGTKDSSSDQQPVESVTWFEAVRFCNVLSKREGLKPFYAIIGPERERAGLDRDRLSLAHRSRVGIRLPGGEPDALFLRERSRASCIRHAWFGEAS